MYGKFFKSAFSGSMMAAGPEVFAVWGYVIAHAVDSRVELNPMLLAAVIGSTPDRMQAAIDKLCAPDPDSRSPECDGRRMVKEGQFQYFIVNHAKYRSIRNEDERREYNRIKKQEERARKADVKVSVIDSQRKSIVSAHTEADTEADIEEPTVLVASATPKPRESAPKMPPCPIERIIESFHRHCPTLPRVMVLNDARKRALSARWREVVTDHRDESDPAMAAADWFDWLFRERVASSGFLVGKATSWQANFDWLMKPTNFAKVAEGNYAKDRR